MSKYPGRVLSATPPSVSQSGASGVWTQEEVVQYVQENIWPTQFPEDPFFQDTVLLLHGDGTNGAQNNTFLDSSTNNFTITRNGNTTQGSFSPFSKPDGRWGALTSDRAFITIPASRNPVAFNTMSFSGSNFFGNGLATAVDGWSMGFAGSGTTVTSIEFRRFASGAQAANTFTGLSIPFSVWSHVALVRSGSGANNLKIYVNGVQQGAAQTAVTYSIAGGNFILGSGAYRQNPQFAGNAAYYISNVRLTKSAIYTTDFTPSTSPLTAISGTTLLILQSNRFINNGTNSGAITSSGDLAIRTRITPFSPFPITTEYSPSVNGGSGYFDGSGDYLTTAYSQAAFDWWTDDFTIEAWIMVAGAGWQSSGQPAVIGNMTPGTTTNYWSFGVNGSLQPTFYYWVGAARQETLTAVTGTYNQWMHIAMCKTSSGIQLFGQGVGGSVIAINGTPQSDTGTPLTIGQLANVGCFGHIANIRIVKGTALYSGSTYTVPSLPPTAVTNTSLLCNFTNAGIFDNTGFNNLETVGNAQIDTTTKKFGTGSLEFDGTTDYVVQPTSDNYGYSTGDFTIEFWAYFDDVTTSRTVVSNLSGAASVNPHIYIFNGTLRYFTASADRITSSSLSTGQWYHIALARSGSSTKMFIDGNQAGSTYTDTNNYLATAPLGIGTYWSGGSPVTSNTFDGYIDDLRITKGVARYTTTFTPPTAAFPNIGEP
jgi:hypothetical protein